MNETIEIDLREIGKTLLKRAWLIILCAVIAGTAFFIYTVNFVTPMYTAELKFYVSNITTDSTGGGVASNDLAVALRLANSYIELLEDDLVLDQVSEKLGGQVTPRQLRSMISASVVGDTEIFAVTVTSPNPQMSADIANALGLVAPGTIQSVTAGGTATPIGTAKVPTGRSSPSYVTNALLGAIVGAVLAVAAILVYMHFDVHVKNEETLEKICNAPVLGFIPDFAEVTKNASKAAKKVRR